MKKVRQRRRHYPYTSLKNKKRALGKGGREVASTATMTPFAGMGVELLNSMLGRQQGDRG